MLNFIDHHPKQILNAFKVAQVMDVTVSLLRFSTDNIDIIDLSAKTMVHLAQYISYESRTWPLLPAVFIFDTCNHLYKAHYTSIMVSARNWYASYILASRLPEDGRALKIDEKFSITYFTIKMLHNIYEHTVAHSEQQTNSDSSINKQSNLNYEIIHVENDNSIECLPSSILIGECSNDDY